MKKLRGENDIEATLQRLDRLTLDEARATAAQTLEVFYGLVRHRRVVMEGVRVLPISSLSRCSTLIRIDLEGNELVAGISGALGMVHVGSPYSSDTISDWMIESMQEIVSKINKAERELVCNLLRNDRGN